jgi:hypothetical protein
VPQSIGQTQRARSEGKALSRGAWCPLLEAQRSTTFAPKDADTTKEIINSITRGWKQHVQSSNVEESQATDPCTRYYTYRKKRSWKDAIRTCDKGTIMSFLKFICENYRVAKAQSLHQYWRHPPLGQAQPFPEAISTLGMPIASEMDPGLPLRCVLPYPTPSYRLPAARMNEAAHPFDQECLPHLQQLLHDPFPLPLRNRRSILVAGTKQ